MLLGVTYSEFDNTVGPKLLYTYPFDVMTVEIEMTPGAQADETSRRQKAGDIVRHIKAHMGVTCEVTIKAVGEVPRSQGKAVRVKDLRKKP